jgi:hypothetical protein
MSRLKQSILWTLFLGILIFLGFNRHSKDKFNNYHSVIWADAAGYSVYLPLTFTDFFQTATPEVVDSVLFHTGEGFLVENNKVITKYSYGVSLFQIIPYAISLSFSENKLPFNPLFHKGVWLVGIILGWISIVLISESLKAFGVQYSWLLSILLFGSTNFFYYAIDQQGMSHVYSLFAFSLVIWSLLKAKMNSQFLTLTVVACSLIVVLRPVNALFIPVLLLIFFKKTDMPLSYIKEAAFSKNKWLLWVLIGVVFAAPQLIYWNYAFGESVSYAYGDEGFENLLSPKLISVWFSTNNGLLLYSPVWIVLLALLFKGVGKKLNFNSSQLSLFLFLAISLLFGSWWSWHFGCGFGHRAYIEFIAPIGVMAFSNLKQNQIRKLIYLLIPFLIYNLKLTYTYDECWLEGNWDYAFFFDTLVFSGTR